MKDVAPFLCCIIMPVLVYVAVLAAVGIVTFVVGALIFGIARLFGG